MTEFRENSTIRQCLKIKPIKLEFKWWLQCANFTGYLSKFDLYLDEKRDVEIDLRESVVMKLLEKLKWTYCTLSFDNFVTARII